MSRSAATVQRGWRMTAFRWGLMVGVLSTIAIAGLAWRLLTQSVSDYAVDVVSLGSDVSRHGGVLLRVSDARGAVQQTCRGECDDLHLQENYGDNAFHLVVLAADGRRLIAGDLGYVDTGYGAPAYRWTLSGHEALKLDERETWPSQARTGAGPP
ncbi:hypothetical protein [Phenylobacterium sp.]|uniref:hypothetical protein n=1 Tax=Phenylobacterium sp. TaxID=1871053 RepID=UPI0025F49B80|nr:hypothetical protein [Phenylobacterium sp.]